MLPDIQLAIRLQILDDRMAELTREIAALPKHIAEIEKKLDGHQRRLEHDRAALTANQRERKNLEGEIQTQDQKASKLRTQMMDAKTNEQFHAFQHEIEFCAKEVRRIEDRILELMTASEPLELAVKRAEAELAGEKKDVEAEKAQARHRTAEGQKELDSLKVQRAQILGEMTPAVASNYERIRKNRAGVAIAEVVNGRCLKCQIMLRLQYAQEVMKGEKILTCESCGRILYHNPPKSVEDLAGASN